MCGGTGLQRHRFAAVTAATAVAFVALVSGASASAPGSSPAGPPAELPCAPLDVVVLLDTSTSMNSAIENVKDNIVQFTTRVEEASGGDYQMALVDFATDVEVQVPFSDRNGQVVRDVVADLASKSRANSADSEAWDEALVAVVDRRPADGIGIDPQTDEPWKGEQIGDFDSPFRPEAKKIIVIITDARPGGFDDHFDQSDIDRVVAASTRARERGIRVATVFVPNGSHERDAPGPLNQASNITGSTYYASLADGSNVTDSLDLAVETCAADNDNDGLYDTWETDGYDADGDGTIDVDLPAMGADPNRKDLFLQVNWMQPDGVVPCFLAVFCPGTADGAHPPDPQALQNLVDIFGAAPVDNPDGTTGITVHIDAGPLTPPGTELDESERAGGPTFEHKDRLSASTTQLTDDEVTYIEAVYDMVFDDARRATHTWVYYVHLIAQDADGSILGLANAIPGDVAYLSGTRMTSTLVETGTLVHEVGHTLGLGHGGLDSVNRKPNYVSIMNYDHLHSGGLVVDGQGGVIDLSRFELATLDEENLNEPAGITVAEGSRPLPGTVTGRYRCPDQSRFDPSTTIVVGEPVDWNCDGDTTDLGDRHSTRGNDEASSPRPLPSRDDWATITFTGGQRGALASAGEEVDETGFTYEAWVDIPKDHAVAVAGPNQVASPATVGLQIPVTVINIGDRDDTYRIDVTGNGDWDLGPTGPASVEVPSREQARFAVNVAIPVDVAEDDTAAVTVTVTSDAADWVGSSHVVFVEPSGTPADPPGPAATVATPGEVTVGDSFEVTGSDFPSFAAIRVVDPSGTIEPADVEADAAGEWTVTVTSPEEPGTVDLVAFTTPDVTNTKRVTRAQIIGTPAVEDETFDDPGTTSTTVVDADGFIAGEATVEIVAASRDIAPAPPAEDEQSPVVPILLVVAIVAVAAVVLFRRRRSLRSRPDR